MYLSLLQKISPRSILILLFFISFFIAGMAYVMEHYFDIFGCVMCHYERDVFIGTSVISLLCLILLSQRLQYYAVLALGFIFLGGAIFAAYHVAIQQHWAALPTFCPPYDVNAINPVNALNSKMTMTTTPFVRCDQVSFSLFGLSLAVYNALASLFLALLCWVWVYKQRQIKVLQV